RHTRSKRDWSSDVCSSDLTALENVVQDIVESAKLRQFVAHDVARSSRSEMGCYPLRGRLLGNGRVKRGVIANECDVEPVALIAEIGRASCRDRNVIMEGAV